MIRNNPIYLSYDVWRWLRLLAKAEPHADTHPAVTPDEIADQILRQAIRERHPELPDHQKQIEVMEKKLVAALQAGKKDQ